MHDPEEDCSLLDEEIREFAACMLPTKDKVAEVSSLHLSITRIKFAKLT